MELRNKRKYKILLETNHNILNYALFEVLSSEGILKLALENIKHKKGDYYSLIKDYILNYEKTDKKLREKIKKIIIFIQKYSAKYGERKTIKDLDKCLKILGAKYNKNLYTNLCSACIKYSDTVIIETILKNQKH